MSAADPRAATALDPAGRTDRIETGGRFTVSAAPRTLRFLLSELRIIFTRRRNIAGLGVIAAVPILIAIAVKVSSNNGGGGPSFIDSITQNGLFVAFAALVVELPLFLPLAIATIAGDAVAGEANQGTLRYLLTVPAGRTRLLGIKYLSIIIFSVVATAIVAISGTLIGLLLFGGGPVSLLFGSQISFAAALGRLGLAVLYLAAGFAALGAVGLFISTLTEQPIGATVALVLVNVAMFVCDTISQLDWLHPYLLTHWWTSFGDLLRDPISTDNISRGLITAAVYAVVFWLAAWARFASKDISS